MAEAVPISVEAFTALLGRETESSDPWVVSQEGAARFYRLVYGAADPPTVGVSPCILLHNVRGGKIVNFRFPPHNSRVRGENEIEALRLLRVGDEIRARTRVVSVEGKTGRSGPMVIVRGETRYSDSSGEPVLISRAALIFR